MAFQKRGKKGGGYASDGTIKLAKDIEVGDVVEGYLLAISTYHSPEYEKDMSTLYMLIDEKVIRVLPAGNINYLIKDGAFNVTELTRITRLQDKKVKGMRSTQFLLEQDDEDTVNPDDFLKAYEAPANEGGSVGGKPVTAAQRRASALLDKQKKLESASSEG